MKYSIGIGLAVVAILVVLDNTGILRHLVDKFGS